MKRTRTVRELCRCEVVKAPIISRGRGSFSARVSRLLELGYTPLGVPTFQDEELVLVLIHPNCK
jgi:hypothetical protein